MKKYIIGIIVILIIIIGGTIAINNYKKSTNQEATENNEIIENDTNSNEEKKTYKAYSYITDEAINNSYGNDSTVILRTAYTSDYLFEISDSIVLATVITIDGTSMEYNEMFGMTYGTLLIDKVIYGSGTQGEVLEYIKPGGYMSMADWEKAQPEAARAKREYLRAQAGIEVDEENTYIKTLIGNDIDLEAGKTYLMYLNHSDSFDKYEIIGLGNGLREVNIPQVSDVSVQNCDSDELMIRNNDTGEWELLNNYIQENITNLINQ